MVQRRISSTAVSISTRCRTAGESSWSGHSSEGEHRAGDGVAGRLGARREQQREERGELVVAQARRVRVGQLGVDDGREHVRRGVARFSSIRAAPYSYMLFHGGLALRAHGQEVGLVGDVEDVLDGVEQKMPVGLGHAEQQADRLHRELGRDVDEEVALLVDGLEEPPHPAAQLLLRGRARPPESGPS